MDPLGLQDQQGVSTATRMRVRRGVIGILRRRERYLLIRRGPNVRKAGYWCFPGGHIEHGETPRVAIQRELAEELGIAVMPEERLGSIRVLHGTYVLAVWKVRQQGGNLIPRPQEIAEVRWLTPSQIRAIQPSLPSNEYVLEMLPA